jgi:hypothetical protein
MIDNVSGSQTTQPHAVKFEGQAQQQVVQKVQNEVVQTGNTPEAAHSAPENKPDHRGQNVDASA